MRFTGGEAKRFGTTREFMTSIHARGAARVLDVRAAKISAGVETE